jgi:hypothetical protein
MLGLDWITFCVAEMTGTFYHTQNLLVEMETQELFAWTGVEP